MITVGSVWPRPISAMNDTPITSLSRPPHPHSHPPPNTRTPPYSSINPQPRQRRVSARREQTKLRLNGEAVSPQEWGISARPAASPPAGGSSLLARLSANLAG